MVFGPSFVALPRFNPPDVTPPDRGLTKVLGQTAGLLGGDKQAVVQWIQRLTHIRAGIARLDAWNTLRCLIGRQAPPASTLGQLPYRSSDRWVALDPASGGTLPSPGRVALLVELPLTYDATHPHSGVLHDELPERIHIPKQTTGVTFHYDQPSAAPPQTLLLAVCPGPTKTWDDDLLADIVSHALDLAAIRTVDYETLCGFRGLPLDQAVNVSAATVGQILPALYFAFNPDGQTVSTDVLG